MARKNSKKAEAVATGATGLATPELRLIDPTWVKLGYNSRIHAEVDEKAGDVDGAVDIFKAGQQQPCIVRQLPDDTLELVAGFGRLRKVTMIRNGFQKDGVTYHDPDRLLLVSVDPNIKTDKDAFIASVRENVRNNPSPLNVAEAQKVLRDDFGMSETEIAELYGYNNTNAVGRFKKLLAAPKELQELVHTGELATDTVLKLLELPKAKRDALLEKAKAEGRKLTAGEVAEAINAHREELEAKKATGGGEGAGGEGGGEGAGDDDAGDAPKKQPRNAAKLKKWVEEYVDREFNDEPVKDLAPLAYNFARAVVDYLNGVGGDQKLWNAFAKLLDNEAGK